MADNLKEVEQRLADREEELRRRQELIQQSEQKLERERKRTRAVSPVNGCQQRKDLFASK